VALVEGREVHAVYVATPPSSHLMPPMRLRASSFSMQVSIHERRRLAER
jgi:hypothetical protein